MRCPVSTWSCVCAISTISDASCSSRPADHDQRQQSGGAAAREGLRGGGDGRGQRMTAEHVVDDRFERPGRQRRETDFEERERDDGRDARPVGPQEGQGPPGKRHPRGPQVTFRAGARRGAVAKSRWAGLDRETAVTPLELASLT